MGFTARWRVENGERFTAELWVKFGRLGRSEERARARRSELATVSSLRTLFWRVEAGKARVDASTASGATPWRSCTRRELTSGARNGVRAPNVDGVLSPVGHVDELGSDSEKTLMV